nr:twin-arginine translocation pathway signal [Mycobacterium decipiens]
MLLIAATGLPASVYCFVYRPDQLINATAAQHAIKAASDGAVAILSYSPDNLNRDFANAKSHLTGEFLDHYGKFTERIVAPIAQEKHIATHASVARAALSELHPESAVVLVFVNQRTESKEKPDPVITAGSILVTLRKVNGSWLISKFDPLL